MAATLTPDLLKERIKAVVVVQTTPFHQDGSVRPGGIEGQHALSHRPVRQKEICTCAGRQYW